MGTVLWKRCHLRVLIHDGIILFQGNFWAFLRGAALMRSSNLRSPSNPDFPLCSRAGVLVKIIFHSIVDFRSRSSRARLSFPPFLFLFPPRRRAIENEIKFFTRRASSFPRYILARSVIQSGFLDNRHIISKIIRIVFIRLVWLLAKNL